MPPGHNGPWGEVETPLRNTGNWLQLFAWVHQHFGGAELHLASERAAKYLLDPSHRPGHGAFLHLPAVPHREENGLIGQAWTIAALYAAFRCLNWEELVDLARSVLLQHRFEPRVGLWRTLGVDGNPRGVNTTLNQQIWFAAAALQDPFPPAAIRQQTDGFLQALPRHIRLSRSGRIDHLIHPRSLVKQFPMGIRSHFVTILTKHTVLNERTEGYLAYVLYGLGRLRKAMPVESLELHQTLRRSMSYARSRSHKRRLNRNRFAYGYNPTGIEMAYASLCFLDEWEDEAQSWLSEQFRRSYDSDSGQMNRSSPDPATLAGRLHEATDLPDLDVSLSDR